MATLHKKRIQKTEILLNRDAPGFFSLYAPKAPSKCYRRRRRLAHGAPMMYTVCPKKTQSRSDYFEGAKRHNIVSTVAKRLSRPFRHRFRCSIPRRRRRKNMYTVCQNKPVAKRLFAGAKRLLRAEGACCWRRRRLVQGKKHSREATIAGAKRLLRAEGACCWRRRRLLCAEGA